MAVWSEKSRSETVVLNGREIDKAERYPWVIKDRPGQLMQLPKSILKVNHKYQRQPTPSKITEITKEFWWIGFNTLTVGKRGGKYWVIDGQHRYEAVMRHSKIQIVPCIVFEMDDVKQEAFAFLLANAGRKPVTVFEKHAASLYCRNDIAVFIDKQLELNQLEIHKNGGQGTIGALALCYKLARVNKQDFADTLSLCARICSESEISVSEKLLHGLWFVNRQVQDGFKCERIVEQICKLGARRLLDATMRASAYYKKGGEKVWGIAILEEVNSKLQKKFKLKGDT